MSYAVRNDKQGWRAVSGPDDVSADEWYSVDTPPDPAPVEVGIQVKTREQVEADRLYAYANPVTGSDRFIAEAMAERLAGNIAKAEAADAALLVRREEIAAQNPWPKKETKEIK